MEAAGLRYLIEHRLIICIEHGRGVVATGVDTHLRNEHRLKGTGLKAALQEVVQLRPQPFAAQELPTVAHHTIHIQELPATEAYHCVLEDCNLEREALSMCRRTVEKHQSRVHRINAGRKRGGRGQDSSAVAPYQIKSVQIQTLLPRPFDRWFIIKKDGDQQEGSVKLRPSAAALAQFEADLETAEQKDRTLYDQVPEQTTQAQLPPWLVRTGISNHLSGMEKETIRTLVQSATEGRSNLCMGKTDKTDAEAR